MGGGLSQLSTTTFNAAYEAGMEDVEHRPHSEWFSRYPAGREATIYTGVLDMRWKNTAPTGVLVQAWVAVDDALPGRPRAPRGDGAGCVVRGHCVLPSGAAPRVRR
jgi:hypothetical protein